ncbi:MAG: hypothetical protein HOI39_03165 [Flavobacteriales bacterium]|jgi:hypothetical protein|nr:hypothetical protein [Flavobacteriales bacterium]
MKKLLLILFISLSIVGCSETSPQQVKFDNESYQWKKWDCFATGYAGDFILTIGYIPELKKDGMAVGKLFLKDSDSPIDTVYQMKGVQHNWEWEANGDTFKIVIESDGTGRYWDFSDTEDGEMVMSKESYSCTSSGYASFSKSFDNFFSY